MDITAADSSIKKVLNLYYGWLVELVKPKGVDKIALMSTIVTEDIVETAPLYTNYIFRQFADRTISVSPEDFGGGNTNDRYSRVYRDLVEIAAADLYANASLTPQQQQTVDDCDTNVNTAIENIKTIRTAALEAWLAYAKEAGLKPGTPQYELAYANYYQPYIAQIKNERQKIITNQAKRRAVFLSVFKSPADREMANVYERCNAVESQQSLPTDLTLETKYGIDPINIGAAADGGMYAFETELGLLPSGTLTLMLHKQGERNETFSNEDEETHNHDSEWHANAGGSWGLWHASGSDSEEEHFKQSIEHLESIKISCDYLGDYWVNRRDWFSSTIFKNKHIVKALKDNPSYLTRLALCISSVIIVRGLKVEYKFRDFSDTAVWSSYNYSGGGGYGVFGIDFGSAGGGSSGNSYDHVINTKEKSVTFLDGPDVCRLLALRVSSLIDDVSLEEIGFAMSPLDQSLLGLKLLELWKENGSFIGLPPIGGPAYDAEEGGNDEADQS
ncbi:hypothetical protein [Rhizobium sp. NZLR4b]|uniref:hypothetical protein n=1 Tax=Rhizobium sp. NZLR4b TaxID=2731102 RepID=UPI001C82FF39|nr:hypothetical protein [Rhizobium sp. NZLR4b]MBX5164804.1 hypothetical protein [Rhizobium sp. NZLR4b]